MSLDNFIIVMYRLIVDVSKVYRFITYEAESDIPKTPPRNGDRN